MALAVFSRSHKETVGFLCRGLSVGDFATKVTVKECRKARDSGHYRPPRSDGAVRRKIVRKSERIERFRLYVWFCIDYIRLDITVYYLAGIIRTHVPCILTSTVETDPTDSDLSVAFGIHHSFFAQRAKGVQTPSRCRHIALPSQALSPSRVFPSTG